MGGFLPTVLTEHLETRKSVCERAKGREMQTNKKKGLTSICVFCRCGRGLALILGNQHDALQQSKMSTCDDPYDRE